MTTLVSAFKALRDVPFPEFPQDDELTDWLADMAEMDGHVAGLASSALAKGRSDIRATEVQGQLAVFQNRLRAVCTERLTHEDLAIYHSCKDFPAILVEVGKHLRRWPSYS